MAVTNVTVTAMALSNAERQRRFIARLKASATPAPGYDPATQVVVDRDVVEGMEEQLRKTLVRVEILEQDRARLEARNAYVEGQWKREEQLHTNALKEIIVLKQAAQKPAKRRWLDHPCLSAQTGQPGKMQPAHIMHSSRHHSRAIPRDDLA